MNHDTRWLARLGIDQGLFTRPQALQIRTKLGEAIDLVGFAQELIDSAVVTRVRMFNDLRDATGPFDVIGDVHGCLAELGELLARLGYSGEHDAAGRLTGASHPHGRTAVFLGDLVDRGPDTPGVLSMVMRMTAAGHALAVAGNHEAKLLRALRGRDVSLSHGLAGSLGQIEAREAEQPGFRAAAERFLDGLVSHYVLDGGRLVVAHAGLKEAFHGRASGRVMMAFCWRMKASGPVSWAMSSMTCLSCRSLCRSR